MPSQRPAPRRTLWEEGRQSGRLVVRLSTVAILLVVLVHLLVGVELGIWFDLALVAICVTAALAVHPRDFFIVGVLPPLLLASTIVLVAILDRSAVAEAGDGLVQATVSGLAHHATALVVGYGLTLVILALRQVAVKNHGAIRVPQQRSASPTFPKQRSEV